MTGFSGSKVRWYSALISVIVASLILLFGLSPAIADPDESEQLPADAPEVVEESPSIDDLEQVDPEAGPNADNDVADELTEAVPFAAPSPSMLKGGVTSSKLASNLGTKRSYKSALLSTGVTAGYSNSEGTWVATRSAVPARLMHVTPDGRSVDKSTTFQARGAWALAEVGNQVVVGGNDPGGLHVFDKNNPKQARQISLNRADIPMGIVDAGGGKIYVGAYNPTGARLYLVNLSTGQYSTVKKWTHELYLRSMAMHEGTLFFTTGGAARVFMLENGSVKELDQAGVEGASLGYSIAASDKWVVVGTEPNGTVAVYDRAAGSIPLLVRKVQIPGVQTIDSMTISDGFAYFTARSDGDLYSLNLDDPASTPQWQGQPLEVEEYRSIQVVDGQLIAVGGSGAVVTANVNEGVLSDVVATPLMDMDSPGEVWGQETAAQGITHFDDKLISFGHWNMTVTDPETGDYQNARVPGEVKTTTKANGLLYLGIYPAARIYTLAPGSTNVEFLASIPGEQMRPRAITTNATDTDVIVSTRPAYGRFGGNITVFDALTGELKRQLVKPFGNDTPTALVATSDALYVGTENYGEAVALPKSQAGKARVARMGVDATSGPVWSIIPVSGANQITSLVLTEKGKSQWLVGTTDNGYVFIVDPSTGNVKHRQRVGSHADNLSIVDGRAILRVDSHLYEGDIGLSEVFLFKISDGVMRLLDRAPRTDRSITTIEVGSGRANALHAYDLKTSAQARRIGGKDRFDVAINASRTGFGKSDNVIITNYLAYADQATAIPLSKMLNAPILLTGSGDLDQRTLSEVKRLGASSATIVGGPPSVSETVVNQLRNVGLTVKRMDGKDRFEVAVSVAKEIERLGGGKPQNIYVATGLIYSDAVIAAPAAAHHDGVVVFTADDHMPLFTREYLGSRSDTPITSVGLWADTAVKRSGFATRTLSGKNRFEVATQVARTDFPNAEHAYMANGMAYADAVVASSLASVQDAPVLLDRASPLDRATSSYLSSAKQNRIVVTMVGGPPSLSVSNQLAIRLMVN
ncbi:MAG: cell wall-binding repeat-containing protein [Acidobacteriota bacterium]|nr:cell wall-binding repeat-containing protein [Acidobacteriota bacterium]